MPISRTIALALAAGLLFAASAARVSALVCSGERDTTFHRIERGVVIHVNNADGLQVRRTRMAGADRATFRELAPSSCFAGYAADKNAVYYEGARIAGADPQSFKTMEDDYAPHLQWYAMDRLLWYGAGVPLAGRRGGELRILNPGYAIHPEGAFYGSRRLERDDFEVLGLLGYARSRGHVYYRGEVIAGVDARTFRLYSENPGYGRDKNHYGYDTHRRACAWSAAAAAGLPLCDPARYGRR